KLMTAVPDWAAGLPIAAKGWCRQCYAAASTKITVEDGAMGKDFKDIPLAEIIGSDGKILCPFHDDSRPSLHIYPNNYHCFACDAHGDHIDWLMMVEGMTRDQAIKLLDNWDGPRVINMEQKTGEMLVGAQCIWNAAKSIAGTIAIKYLETVRGIDTSVLPDNDAL